MIFYFLSVHREEENYYALSLSYSYSYSYNSPKNKQSHVAETSTDKETKVSIDTEDFPGNSDNFENISSSKMSDMNLDQSSVDKEITVMPSIVSLKADIDNIPSMVTPMTAKNNTNTATNALLKTDYVVADSSDMENTTSLAKTMIGLGIGFAAVVALLSLKKRHRRLTS